MRIIGNLLWWLFGGLEAAIGYFTGSLALACTIIGIPFALQTFKIGLLCLWPFGSTLRDTDCPTGCIRIPLNLLWLFFGGLWACLMHLFFGLLLCLTLIGIPWGKQHFKVAGLSLAPFGKDVKLGFYGKKNVSKKRPASSSYGIWFILPICRNPDFIIAFLGQVYLSTEQLPMKAKYQSVHILTFHHL